MRQVHVTLLALVATSGVAIAQPVEPPAEPEPDATAEPVDPEQLSTELRLRRIEQPVQSLKERAWRAKVRAQMMQERLIGVSLLGAPATLVHQNEMGSSFRLTRLVYALDGEQIFARSEDTTPDLYKRESFDVFSGTLAPGGHTLSVLAVYRGHGYGVFKYLDKYTFTVRASHTFTAADGQATRIEVSGIEQGGRTTPLPDRPAIEFAVSAGSPIMTDQ